MGNKLDANKTKQLEDAEAAHAGLVIMARLIARSHLQKIRGFETTGDEAEHSENGTERRGNG